MKNFLQVNRALVAEKKHLLLNQLFGTEGSPNQTGKTLTRENRIGLMSYLRRTLMLLFAVLVMSMANIGQMWADYYAPSTDEVIILNTVYDASKTTAGYSKHSAIAWGGTASTNSKTAGDPNNGGAATSGNVGCYNVKGNGGAKNITVSITGCEKIIVYHENLSDRYVRLHNDNESGSVIGSGSKSTYYTEVNLTPATTYSIFLEGWNGSKQADFYVYAVKLIKGGGGGGTPCFSATIDKNSGSYSVSGNSSKNITSDATVTSGGAVTCVNSNSNSRSFSFSSNGVSSGTSDGYVQFTLPSGSTLTTGSVIRVQGYADNAAGGLLLIDDDGTTVASQTNSGALDFSYTVTAGSAINGLDHIRLKRARTSGTNAVKTVTVTGCGAASSEHWYVYGNFSDGSTWGDTEVEMDGNVNISLPLDAHDYSFKIKHVMSDGETTYYSGNNGIMSRGECTNWDMNVDANCRIRTDISGTYNFALTLNESTPRVTVTYPTGGVPITLKLNNGGSDYSWYTRSGEPIIRPNFEPSKDGYAFDGWYANEECTEPWNWSTTVSSATMLYAKWSNAWFYHGEWDDDWAAKTMTRSDHGSFWYRKTSKADGNRLFKIQQNGSWYGYQYISKEYMCTNWTNMNDNSDNWGVSDNRCAIYNNTDDNYYIIVFPPYTAANPTANPIICASSSLPEDYYVVSSGRTIYFDNSSAKWSGIYFRRGRSCHNAADPLTKVPGTDNLYKYTVGTAYNGYQAFHLANNTSWTNNNSIYLVNGSGYEITKSLEFQKYTLDEDVTFTPGDEGDKTDGCQYYVATKTSGMKTDRVTISPYSNGTITVNYTNTSGSAATLTSGSTDLAHTVKLTSITAVANTGYDAGAITINGGAYSANHVVTGNTTIAATFSPHVYSITYKDKGGSDFSGTHTDTPSAHPTSHTYNTATDLNGATKTGYTFGGWYTTSDCSTGLVTSLGATDYTADITLYAKWTLNSHTLTWNLADGTVTTAGTQASEGATGSPSGSVNYGATVTAPVVAKTGYAFSAWTPAVVSPMPDEDKTYTATWTAVKVSSISVAPSSKTLAVGGTQQLTATASPDNALDKTVTWSTSDGSVATVSSTGLVTAVAAGTATITATANDGSGKTGTCSITVEAAAAACYTFTPATSGSAPSQGDVISGTGSGGTMVAGTGQSYTANGLIFESSGDYRYVTVTLDNNLKEGSIIAVTMWMDGTKENRGLYLQTSAGTQKAEWKFTADSENHQYSYTVEAGDGLINTNVFRLARINNVYLKTVTVSNCGDAVCTTPTTAFANGAYTVGGSALDLSTLISGKEGTGAITYTVKNANGTGATIAGTSFTATSAGTATVTATQAANGDYCEKVMDATITVSAGGGYPAGYIYITDVKATPETGATAAASSLNSYDTGLNGSFDKGDFTGTKYAITSSSSGTYTLTFSPALDVSSYTNRKLDVWWGTNGTGSNSGISVKVNGSEVYSDATNADRRNKIQIGLDNAVTATSITTIQLKGASNSGTVFFRVGVKGTPAASCTVAPTVSATTKGATTSTTQVVNCSGISSLGTGTCTITSYGFVYGTSANPTLSDSHVEVGTSYTVTGTAFAETTLTGLTPGTTYYVRAYATNGAGTGYGDAVSFTTSAAPAGAPVITDQPTLSEVALGETASFSLIATGATSYQWYSCDSEGENKTEASGASAATASYSYTTTATGTTYYICKVSNASGDTWSDVVGSIVNPVSFTIHYEAGSTNGTTYTTETFTQTKEVNAAVEDYIGSLTKYAFTGVGISDKGKNGTMSMMIDVVGDAVTDTVGKRVSFSFVIANNYQLDIDDIDFQVQAVTKDDESFQVVMTDQVGTTIVGTLANPKNGNLTKISFTSDQLAKNLVGRVNVVLYGWCASSETAKYRIAKDFYIRGEVSSLPAPTASWTARPSAATVGDGGKTYTLTTDATNTVAWTIEDQTGATSAALSATSGLTTTLSSYSAAGSLYVQAAVTGDGIHYLSTPATILRQLVTINGACGETTLISATLSSGSSTGAVTGTPGGTSNVKFEYTENVDGGYKMGKDGSYMRLALGSGNFEANDVVKITITKASNIGDGALHIYKYASSAWMELGSVTAAGAGTYSYTLTETNVSTAFNTIGLYRTGSNQNPYVKALSVVRSSCSASKPSSVTVTATPAGPYAIGATPTLTVTATNAETYQWYSNTSNTASDGFLLEGETATTYSPSTTIAGTTYYYCVATNTSGSTVSNIITVTVNSAKPTPEVSWEDTYETPNYGGGGYAVKATVSTGAWDGTLTTDMLTASDGVTLSDVSVSGKVITATYGVTEAARSPIAFTLTLPETTDYTALEANSSNITFTSCEGSETTEETKIPVLSAYTTSSNPTYRWETADVGWFTWETGASTISSESGSYSGFSYRTKSGKSSVLFYSELDAVRKVRLYIRGAGPTTLSKVQTGTAYNKYKTLTASTDYNVAYSNASSSIESKEDGYIEISFKSYLSAGTFVAITLSRNTYYYGVELITGTEEVGTIDTEIAWAAPAPTAEVGKTTIDANFRYVATKEGNANAVASLGTISYKSSKPAVATVNAVTGVVDIQGAGSTIITATLASSGCYKKATTSYTLVVTESVCEDAAGTITATTSASGVVIDGNTVEKGACDEITLTVSGHTAETGVSYQWKKDGENTGANADHITVTAGGDYTVEVTNTGGAHCTMPATNTITVISADASITKVIDEWYVKNGRRTPDIALATIEGTDSWKVNDGSADVWVVADGVATTTTGFAGCDFELRDGTIYLKGMQSDGSEPSGLTAGDVTLTITADAECGVDPTASIEIHKQVSTAKPSVAFVVDGTSGNPVNEVATTKTSSRPIWVYLSTYFDLTGCNAYWTNNEKQIRQYYSQFDAIVITDDPNTGTGPTSGKKYVNALGTMVDVRPILTMEAYVGKYGASSNWHIGATPSSPNPRQYEMKLQCKDHDIFAGLTAGANFRSEEIDGETYYYVTMVDNSVTPYKGVADDASTEDYPALQGFSAAAIKGTDLLGIGTILNGTLQGGIERQNEPTARMMILGIQHQAMGALTAEGKQVIKNAIEYLLKTNMEDVDDCSNFFIGGTDGHAEEWHTASNWSSGKLPDASTKARILAPVTISTKVHVAQVDIAIDGTSKRIAGTCNGKVTIDPTGALIVDGQVRRTTNGRLFTEDELEPTTPADLVINTDVSNQGALIFDNSNGETQATVQVYSKSYKDGSDNRHWQYLTSPLQETPVTEFFYGIGTYTFKYEEARGGWVQYNLGTTFDAFDAIGLTQAATKTFHFYGPLASTEDRELNLTYGSASGENMFGNSWTAPIQLTAFTDADFTGGVEKTFYVYNTGYDAVEGTGDHADASSTAGQWQSIPLSSLAILTGDGAWEGLKVIPAYQAYYVKCNSAGTIALNYDKHVRPATYDTNEPLRAPRRMTGADSEVLGMRISVQNDAARSDIYLLESDQFTEGFDNGWDGNYFSGDANVSQFYSVSPMGKMAVSALPDLDGTILGFEPAKKNEEYTFTFHCNDGEYYLNDLKLEQSTLIQTDESYTFTMEEGDSANRFYISATPFDKPGIATGVTDLDADAPKVQKIIYNDKLYIIRGGKVYSAEGQLVK